MDNKEILLCVTSTLSELLWKVRTENTILRNSMNYDDYARQCMCTIVEKEFDRLRSTLVERSLVHDVHVVEETDTITLYGISAAGAPILTVSFPLYERADTGLVITVANTDPAGMVEYLTNRLKNELDTQSMYAIRDYLNCMTFSTDSIHCKMCSEALRVAAEYVYRKRGQKHTIHMLKESYEQIIRLCDMIDSSDSAMWVPGK